MVIVLFLALISLGTRILHRASKFSGTALKPTAVVHICAAGPALGTKHRNEIGYRPAKDNT